MTIKHNSLHKPTRRIAKKEVSANALRCCRKFLRFFPNGFQDEKYLDFERNYKWQAHEKWNELLNKNSCHKLLQEGNFAELADRAVKIESKTNLLFSFEKIALRDAVKEPEGARIFADGLYQFLYGSGGAELKFERWCKAVAALPRKQTRVLTWPVLTVFGFIAQPDRYIFFKPNVTRNAASAYGFDFSYQSQSSFTTYNSLLAFSDILYHDLSDLEPRDMIDIQSFIWVLGSDEY